MTGARGTLEERLWRFISPEPNSGCWLWTGTTRRDYGQIAGPPGLKKTMLQAHVVAYELYVGKVPSGLELDHLCRVRQCVNPSHLEPVTRAVNMQRSPLAGRNKKSHPWSGRFCKNGHERTDDNMRIVPGTPYRECIQCRKNVSARAYLRLLDRKRGLS